MAVRPGMTDVIAALRRLTGADAAALDDDALQALCDARVQTATAEPLTAVRWSAAAVVWAWAQRTVERDPALFVVYAGGALDDPLTVGAEAFNFERAEVTLAESVQSRFGQVHLTYSWFPLPLVAVDVWRTLAAAAASNSIDVKTDNHELKRSQVVAHYLKMAQAAEGIVGGTGRRRRRRAGWYEETSPMISAEELDALRADIARLTLLDACTILTPVETVQPTGEVVRTFTPSALLVPCRLDPVQVSPETGAAGRTGIEDEYVLTLPWDVGIDSEDRIEIGGVRYQVNSLHDTHSLRAVKRARVRTERLP